MDVSTGTNEMRVVLDHHRSEAPAKYRPVSIIAVVDPLREAGRQEAHAIRQPAFFAEHQQMEMIAQEAVCMNLEPISFRGSYETLQKYLPVVVGTKNGRAIDGPVHDMMPGTFMIFA
jgi:hypothetical protein